MPAETERSIRPSTAPVRRRCHSHRQRQPGDPEEPPPTERSILTESSVWPDDESDFEDEWVKSLNNAKTVTDGIRILYQTDKEVFYTQGLEIIKMLQIRFNHNLDDEFNC